MKRRNPLVRLQRIDEILHKALKKHKLPLKTTDRSLLHAWHQAVGPRIAAQTHPECIKKTLLFVKVSSPAWMQQLHFLKQDILDKFNRLHAHGPVSSIFFSMGEVHPPTAPKKASFLPAEELPALSGRDRKMIEKSLASVADEELRSLLRRVMIKELSRRRMLEGRRDR